MKYYNRTVNKRRSPLPFVTFIAVTAIIAVSVAGGFAYDKIVTRIEQSRYPLDYSEIVEKYCVEYDIPREVVYAVIKTESGFNPDAVSKAGAIGLMQLMPETFEWLLTKTGEPHEMSALSDPEINIRYGCYLISILREQLTVWDNVYAAYNAGIGRVRGWLADESYTEGGVLTDIPIDETANYVVSIKKNILMYRKLYFA